MKKFIVSVVAIVLSISISAQDFKYHSLEEVNGDTILYLQKNFIDQKAYFIGKPFSTVMDVYFQDIPLRYSAKITTSPWENSRDRTKYIKGISISWFTVDEAIYYVDNHLEKVLFLDILFEPPYTEIGWKTEKICDTDEKMVNHLKNYIVKDIKLL